MSDEVTIAIISLISATIVAGLGFLGQIMLNRKKSREEELKEAKKQQYQDDRDDYFDEQINIIKKKLDEHNHYAKKFEEVNIKMTGLQKDIEYLRKDFSNVTCRPKTKKD
ncbi:MAG: hypothetical protein J6S67_21580 [Methanobrevibacter sp.]|nr:hypothetical protein [Methanobrevibacter sp.]